MAFTATILSSIPSEMKVGLVDLPDVTRYLRPATIGYPPKTNTQPDSLIFCSPKPMATLSAEIRIFILMVNLPTRRSFLPAGAEICNYHAPYFIYFP